MRLSLPMRVPDVLLANAVILTLIGVGTAVLALALHRVNWGIVWLAVGLIASQGMLLITLRKRGASRDLDGAVQAVTRVLDAQTQAIFAQQAALNQLQYLVTDPSAQQAHSLLNGQVAPALAALVGQLAEAEDALPCMLPQTREWLARVRGLATQTQAQIEAISRALGTPSGDAPFGDDQPQNNMRR